MQQPGPPQHGEEAAGYTGEGWASTLGSHTSLVLRASQVIYLCNISVSLSSCCKMGTLGSLQGSPPFLILATLSVLTSPLSQEPRLPEILSASCIEGGKKRGMHTQKDCQSEFSIKGSLRLRWKDTKDESPEGDGSGVVTEDAPLPRQTHLSRSPLISTNTSLFNV